ncbi:MAG: alkaline shock response membrane anchor protein AmaP [Clostridia bacterium]|nr:alkaline shock response membrane anchor protein AmaP [Clostridia bacterium]
MKRLDRAALALFGALVGLTLTVVFACAIAPDMAETLGRVFVKAMRVVPLRLFLIAACLALAVLVFGWIWRRLHGEEKEEDAQPVSLTEGEGGSVQITPAALEALVRRAAGPVRGVNRFDVRLEPRGAALDVTLVMSVRQGVRIPELAQEAQQNVREAIEDMTGAKVGNVSLLVSEITLDAQTPSEGKK